MKTQIALDAIKDQKTIEELASQYTGKVYTGALKNHGFQISMDGKESCMDNIFIEKLWRSVKCEKIFLEEFETVSELLSGLQGVF